MDRVTERAVGTQLIKAIRPEQQIVKIVHDELTRADGPGGPQDPASRRRARPC